MTAMSAGEIALLKSIAAGQTGGGLYSDTSRPYANAYNFIRNFLGGDAPGAGVDVAVWNWFKVAEGVNRGAGSFSSLIRNYTASQVASRKGASISQAALNAASDAIAQAVIDDIANSGGSIPTLRNLGINDAAKTVATLALNDPAIWSGNPLFVGLGDDFFLKANILENQGDTYDALAMIRAGKAAIPSASTLSQLYAQMSAQLQIDGLDFAANGASAAIDTIEFLTQAYGGEIFSGDIVSSLLQFQIWIAWQDSASTISLSEDVGIIHAGDQDDKIILAKGAALIDGGSGTDSIEFKTLNALKLVFSKQDSTVPFSGLVFEEGGDFNPGGIFDFKRAALYDIEKIKLTNHEDTVSIGSLEDVPQDVSVDGGKGEDKADLSTIDKAITISLESEGEVKAYNSDGMVTLKSVESWKATNHADSVRVTDATDFSSFQGYTFDLQSAEATPGVGDTISAKTMSSKVSIDLRDKNQQTLTAGGGTISLKNATAAVGGSGNDDLKASRDGGALVGNGGADTIVGGTGSDRLVGGYGGDETGTYSDDGAADTITSGGGSDSIYFGDNDTLTDSARGSKLYFANGSPRSGLRSILPVDGKDGDAHLLTGGEEEKPPENPCDPEPDSEDDDDEDGVYEGADGERYTLSDGTLEIEYNGSKITLETFRNGDGGIKLKEKRPDQDQAECNKDPLIIDLDGDRNVVRELFDSSAYFDLDNDGFRERVAWTLPRDGFLVRDRNGNGQIDDGSELFGTGHGETEGGVTVQRGTSGFAELAMLDSNHDRIISALDADFAALRVWVDANGDAITDDGELRTLADLGIVSISLETFKSDDLDCGCDGSEVTYRSNVAFGNGSLVSMYDAYLSIDQYDTREIVSDVTVPTDFAQLPFLIGTGVLSDLDVAMARDPALEELVRSFAGLSLSQADQIGALAEQILLRWTGADSVAPDSRGGSINARWLKALEVVGGSDFNQVLIGTDPRGDAATILITEWSRLIGDVTAKLLGQTDLGQTLLPGLRYEGAAFYTVEAGTTLQSVISKAALSAPIEEDRRLEYWHAVGATLLRYANVLGTDKPGVLAALDPVLDQQGLGLSAAELTESLIATSAGGGFVFDSTAELFRGRVYVTDRTLIATEGDAHLDGGGGDDRYVVTSGVDRVSIADLDGTDRLELRGWSRANTQVATKELRSDFYAPTGELYASYEVKLTQGDSEVTFQVDFRNGRFFAGVDAVEFDDGNVGALELVDFGDGIIRGAVGAAHSFSDSSVNQYLIGRSSADTYRLTATSGTDVILDTSSLDSLNDVLQIAALRSDTSFFGFGADLKVGIIGSNSGVTISGQFKPGQGIEYFEFSDGSRASAAEILTGLTTGTAGADNLHGTLADDVIDGKGGADVLAGGAGRDTYIFRPGYGQLTIDDLNGRNVIRIEGVLDEDDIDFSPQSDGLRISVGDNGDVIVMKGDPYGANASIELNGSLVDISERLVERAQQAGTLVGGRVDGTPGDDFIYGSSDADLIAGNGGFDRVNGSAGNDTYLATSGVMEIRDGGFSYDTVQIDGKYSIADLAFVQSGYSGSMRLRFGGTELRVDLLDNKVNSQTGAAILTEGYVERVTFADGYTLDLTAGKVTAGGAGNDVLFNYGWETVNFTPDAGDDYIFAVGDGNHTLQLEAGFGHDVFYSRRFGNVTFSGISLDNHVSFARDGFDLVVRVADGADTLTLKNAFEPLAEYPNRNLIFDGSQINVAQIVSSLTVASTGDDLLWGRNSLDGGAGNDILIGSGEANSYVFARGYGHDVIKEQDGIFGNDDTHDTLTLVGLNRNDVTFARSASDPLSIVITIKETGETLTLDGTPFDTFEYNSEDRSGDGNPRGDRSGAHWIDQIIFADGTTMSQRDVEQAVINAERTSGSDILDNFGAPSGSFLGEPGAILDGGAGNDTYVNQFDDIYVGMSAGTGSDRVINHNGGRTRINVSLSGIAASDVLVTYGVRDGRNVTVLSARTGDELVIDGHSGASGDLTVMVTDPIAGESYKVTTQGALSGGQATAGSDYINGERSDPDLEGGSYYGEPAYEVFDETFNPGNGDDVIAGRGGSDTIVFNRGDGADEILRYGAGSRNAGWSDSYTIQLGAGLNPAELKYEWLNDGSYRVRLSLNEDGDSVTVDARQRGALSFADGTLIQFNGARDEDNWPEAEPGSEVTVVDLFGKRPAATTEGEVLFARRYETIDGLGGDDTIYALESDATIRFGRGSGNDTLFVGSAKTSNYNTVVFTDIASPSEIEVLRGAGASSDLVIRIRDTGEELRIAGHWFTDDKGTSAAVEYFEFAGGETFSPNQMLALVAGDSEAGDGTITSGNSGGILNGGAGNDTLAGGSGNDFYEFGRGFDEDLIRDSGGTDTINFAEGVSLTDLFFSRRGVDGSDLLIEVTGLERLALTVAGQFVPGAARIENFQFADGRSFAWSDIEAMILDRSQTGGNDTILGFTGNDVLRGLAGNDVVSGLSGDDVIDGGEGRDTASYRGVATEYTVATVNGVTTVSDTVAGRDGTDTLTNVEELRFAGGAGSIVQLVAPNRAPVAGATAVSGIEDNDVVILRTSLMALASDPDGDALRLSVANASHGKVWLGVDGNVRFRPDANFGGEAGFDYTVADANGSSATARVTVTVSSVNDAPVLTTDFADVTVLEDRPVLITVPTTLFADADGDTLTISVSQVGGGSLPAWLSFADGTLSGTPPADFNGDLDLVVTGSDGTLSASIPFTLSIVPVNDAPRLVETFEDRTAAPGDLISIALPTSSFVDVEGDVVELAVTLADGGPLPSWLTYAEGQLQGTVPPDQDGPVGIAIRASDGRSVTTALFQIVIEGNDAPVSGAPLTDVNVLEDVAVAITLPADAFTDPDGDELSLSATLDGGDPLPSWLIFSDGQFSGQPPANFNGTLDIVVTASDGTLSKSSGFSLIIGAVNDAPIVAEPLADASVVQGDDVEIVVPAGTFTDVDGDELVLSARLAGGGALPSWLTFDAGTRSFSGTVPSDVTGQFDIELVASDGSLTAADVLRLTISPSAPVNRAPVVAEPLQDASVDEGGEVDIIVPAGSFTDADGDELVLSARLAGGDPLPSWLAFDAITRRFSGTSPSGFTGQLDLEVVASDGTLTAADVFRLTVSPASTVNHAPVLAQPMADVTALRGSTVDIAIPVGTFNDEDGDALSYSATRADGTPLPAWLTFSNGHLTGTVAAGALGDYAIRVTASDGSLSVNDVFNLSVEMLPTGPERSPSQQGQLGEGNDRMVGRGAANYGISAFGGDDYLTADGWNVSLQGDDGNDVLEFMSYGSHGEGGTGADTFIFDGFSLVGGDEEDPWATVTDFEKGTDRIGIVNGTAGVFSFFELAPHLAQSGADVEIAFDGLPRIIIEDVLVADLDASDFMFGNWATSGGFGAAPAAGAIPWPVTTVTRALADWANIGNASERIVGYGAGNTPVETLDGNDYITSDGWAVRVYAGRGNDVIELFGSGNYAFGGPGYDYFVFDSTMLEADALTEIWATIGDFHDGADKIAFLNGSDGLLSFTDLVPFMSQDGDHVRIVITGHPAIVIENVSLADLTADDFVFANQQAVVRGTKNSSAIRMGNTVGVTSVTANGFTNVTVSGTANGDVLDFTDVTLTNIVRVTGGEGDDVITGNTAANVIWGGAGDDTIRGGDGNDSVLGDAGDDVLSGGAGTDTINGGANVDTVDYSYATADLTVSLAVTAAQTVSAGDVDTITNVENLTGGSGNDTLTGTTGANVIRGGGGNDTINAGRGNDEIDGGAGTDKALFAGVSTTYTISTVNGAIQVVDNATSQDGNDGTDTLLGVEIAEFKNGVQVGLAAPVVLDLDGDGVELLAREGQDVDRAVFDWDGDGLRDRTGWVGGDDGFLVYDRDGNGTVTDAGELSFTGDKPGAKSDLDGLTAFDSNGDGVLSAEDDKFAGFRVWRDGDGDGAVGTDEFLTLEQAGVASISLGTRAVNRTWGWDENIVINDGGFTRTDGSEASLADVALNFRRAEVGEASFSSGSVQRTAAQLAEALATFGTHGGMGSLYGQRRWLEHQDVIFTSSARPDLR